MRETIYTSRAEMLERAKLAWVRCPHCTQQTPAYMERCFKCRKLRHTATAVSTEPHTAPAVSVQPVPVGWWDCSSCRMQNNPPLSQKCLMCSAPRQKLEKAPSGFHVPTDLIGFLRRVATCMSVLGNITAVAGIFLIQLRPISVFLKTAAMALQTLLEGKKMVEVKVDGPDDIKDFTEVERALIATVKIILKKKDFGAIVQEMINDAAFHAKVKAALENCQDIPAEIKTMTVSKVMDIAKVAIEEISA